MPNPHRPPAYLRYLRARLWNLARPGFWGTTIFLAVVGLVIREYWLNPEIFTLQQNHEFARQQSAQSSLSNDDQAIVADIDNLKVLLNDAEQARLAALVNTPTANPQQQPNKSLFPDVIKPKPASNDAKTNPGLISLNGDAVTKQQNLFVLEAENLLQMGTGYSNNQLLGIKSTTTSLEQTAANPWIGLPNQTENNQNTVIVSPLQAAVNQLSQQNFSSVNGLTSSQTNTTQGTGYGSTTLTPAINNSSNFNLPANNGINAVTGYNQPTVTNLQPNSLTNFNNTQVLPSVAPVTPPVTAAVNNNLDSYSLQTPNQNAIAPTTSDNYTNPTVQQQPTPAPQYNTLPPRPTPGAYGGVEINGYRYP